MADSRFFRKADPIRLSDVAALTGAVITAPGKQPDGAKTFKDIAPLDKAGADDISFLDNVKYVEGFTQSKAGACFVRPKFTEHAPAGMVLLVTDQPYYAFAMTARYFYPESGFEPGVSPQAVIARDAKIGKNARIDSGAVIGNGVTIGGNCWIGANTVIGDGVEIGDNCRIGANCTISHAVLSSRITLHRGIHIGQDGFGFAPSRKGILKVPQVGRVLIGNDVEIGSGTCIDRGAGPDTVIGDGSKIDNLVQIGHNVQIGKNVLIAAQCGLAGSTIIGDGVMLGGQVGISGHVKIGAGARIAAQAGIMTDIPPGATYGGSPAVPARDWHRQTVALARITKREKAGEE